jgi:type VI protein secretion system component VasK
MAVGDVDLLGQVLTQLITTGPVATILGVVCYFLNSERRDTNKARFEDKDKHAAELAKLVEGTTSAVNNNNTVLTGLERELGRRRKPAVRRRGGGR